MNGEHQISDSTSFETMTGLFSFFLSFSYVVGWWFFPVLCPGIVAN